VSVFLLQRVLVAIMTCSLLVLSVFTDSTLFHIYDSAHHRGVRRHAFSVGLWTPFVGTLIAVIELWIAVTHVSDPWISIMWQPSANLGDASGRAQFSIDAVLFGRNTWT